MSDQDCTPTAGITPAQPVKPEIRIPSSAAGVSHCAEILFPLIRERRTLFNRDKDLVEVALRGGEYEFNPINAAAAVSRFEDYAQFVKLTKAEDGEWQSAPVTLKEQDAKLLLETRHRKTELDTIRGILQFPLLVERDHQLVLLQNGYDPESGLFITNPAPAVEVSLQVAVNSLKALLEDYSFQSNGDRSRALASFLTPALKFGGFINGPIPIDVGEADESQAGKSYRQTLVPALYNHRMTITSVPHGGVGSLDESLYDALIRGKSFIQIDNVRGKLNSTVLESMVTAHGEFSSRAAFIRNTPVDCSKAILFVSSNGFLTTPDLANRSSIIRLRRQPAHIWRTYDGLDLRQYIQAHIAEYQGAVMAVIREWHARGKPRTGETRHSFQDWCQILDWILQNVLMEAPLLEGHESAKLRCTNPHLSFIRQVALAVEATGRLETPFSASNIVELCEQQDIPIPGLRATNNETAAPQLIGRIMSATIKQGDELVIESYRIRRVRAYTRSDAGNPCQPTSYTVTRLDAPPRVQASPTAPMPLAA